MRMAITRAREEEAAADGGDSSDDLGAVRSSRPCRTERPPVAPEGVAGPREHAYGDGEVK
ncbi:hypothetical protein PS9374_01995 [Planomonospora sphaerica]|uniref:Uncharacterized protein n=1 Tax=Planomonospora sphaerica TaxID=161355 RepID=A0A161LN90_9ACTN|nr:hypothetical protein PS9374_01995 [Planomonospora sphaerica]